MVGAVMVDGRGENYITLAPGALAKLTAADVREHARAIEGADVCVVSLEISLDAAAEALRIARTHGIATVLNPAPAPTSQSAARLLALADWVTPNEREAAAMCDECGSPEDRASALLALGARGVVITLGPGGALVATAQSSTRVPAADVPEEELVDTAGAGDAFNAAFATALAAGVDAVEAAVIGCQAGSRICRGPGFVEALAELDGLEVPALVSVGAYVGYVRTVLGDVDASELGLTYAHEHLVMAGGRPVELYPDIRLDSVGKAVEELALAQRLGLAAVVDAMPADCGRDIEMLVDISRRSGVHILASTGLHTARYYSDRHWSWRMGAPEIARLFIDEVEQGIDAFDLSGPTIRRTRHRAGVIKVGGSAGFPDGRDRKVFEAAAMAQSVSGAPILTHCEDGRRGPEQVRFLVDHGADPRHVILSHVDKVVDRSYHREIAETGAYVEFDQGFRWREAPNGTLQGLLRVARRGRAQSATSSWDTTTPAAATGRPTAACPAWITCSAKSRLMEERGLAAAVQAQVFVANPSAALTLRHAAARLRERLVDPPRGHGPRSASGAPGVAQLHPAGRLEDGAKTARLDETQDADSEHLAHEQMPVLSTVLGTHEASGASPRSSDRCHARLAVSSRRRTSAWARVRAWSRPAGPYEPATAGISVWSSTSPATPSSSVAEVADVTLYRSPISTRKRRARCSPSSRSIWRRSRS